MPRQRADLQLRSQLVRPFLAFVRERGGDADGLSRRFRLPATAEQEPELILPLSVLRDFFEAAEEAVRDPFLDEIASQLRLSPRIVTAPDPGIHSGEHADEAIQASRAVLGPAPITLDTELGFGFRF